jgi:cyclic pyranopterin phosphate synthase
MRINSLDPYIYSPDPPLFPRVPTPIHSIEISSAAMRRVSRSYALTVPFLVTQLSGGAGSVLPKSSGVEVASCCRMQLSFAARWIGTHVGPDGLPGMVDVAPKVPTSRTAIAESTVYFPAPVVAELRRQKEASTSKEGPQSRTDAITAPTTVTEAAADEVVTKKGPILATAIIAGTMAVKNTSNLIPFCHPLLIEKCKFGMTFAPSFEHLTITCEVQVTNKTGVEMEALTGASVAALTVYDMLKGIEGSQPGMRIGQVRLVEKTGGKHGRIHNG